MFVDFFTPLALQNQQSHIFSLIIINIVEDINWETNVFVFSEEFDLSEDNDEVEKLADHRVCQSEFNANNSVRSLINFLN